MQLCRACEEYFSCQEVCQDSIVFEKEPPGEAKRIAFNGKDGKIISNNTDIKKVNKIGVGHYEFESTRRNEMNKQEAEKELERKLNLQGEIFCPLIKENCVMTCICLVQDIYKNKYSEKNEYRVNVYCNNAMFFRGE